MPWTTLLVGCLAGTAVLAVVARIAESSHWPLGQGAVRLAFVPAIAALAFVPRAWFRPVTQAAPVPAWITPAGHILLAAPVLAITCSAQLALMTRTIAVQTSPLALVSTQAASRPPAVYPLIAQLTGWCAVTVAVGACTDRSRYSDLGGAVAAPVSLVAIALAWYIPLTSKLLVEPPATALAVTIAWYAVGSGGLILTGAAMRDQWHRYSARYSWIAHVFPSGSSKKQKREPGVPSGPSC